MMKLSVLLFVFGLVAMGYAIKYDKDKLKAQKEQYLKDLIEMNSELKSLRNELIEMNWIYEAKIAKEYLKIVTIYYTRIENSYSTESKFRLEIQIDQMMVELKDEVKKFVDTKKVPSYNLNDLNKFKINKNDDFEYRLNLLQVYLRRGEQFLREHLTKCEDDQKYAIEYNLNETKKYELLIDSILIETQSGSPIHSGKQNETVKEVIDYVHPIFERFINLDEIKEEFAIELDQDSYMNEYVINRLFLHSNILALRSLRTFKQLFDEDSKGRELVLKKNEELEDYLFEYFRDQSNVINQVNRTIITAEKLFD